MKKSFIVVVFIMLAVLLSATSALFSFTNPGLFLPHTDGHLYNVIGDSIYFILGDSTLIISPAGLYYDPDTVLSRALVDSIVNGYGRFAGGAGLTYWTESDDNDTSVFTATGPNTTVGLNDDLTMQGNSIIGVGSIRSNSYTAKSSPGHVWLGNSNDSVYLVGFGYTVLGQNTDPYRIASWARADSAAHDTADVVRGEMSSDADSLVGIDIQGKTGNLQDNYILIVDITGADTTLQWEAETGGSGEANTLSDTGTFNGTEGFGLAGGKTGVALKVKGLIEGSNVTIAASGDSAYTITAAGGSGVWVASNDTMFLVDADSDTLAAFWDDDAGNVWWQVATEDQTLKLKIDSLLIGGEVLTDLSSLEIIVTSGQLRLNIGGVLTGHINNQTITKDDIDTTAYNFPFDGAYHVTTAVAGSAYVTIQTVAEEIEDSLNEYSLTSAIASLYPDTAETVDTIQGVLTEGGYLTDSKLSDSSITLLNATAWRLFYSNAATTAIQELILGGNGTYLKSNGASSAPTWATPGGAAWNWTDSTGFLVGWGGVAKSVVNDTNYFRFEGGADFDTTGGSVSIVDDSHNHIYSNIDEATSANWAGRVSDETGTGVWVFGTNPTLTTGVKINLAADSNVTIDARTNNRTVTMGALRLNHTPQGSTPGTRAIYLDVDANSVPGTQGLHINYEATALAAGEVGLPIDIECLTSTSTGGLIRAVEVSRSGIGAATVHALHASAGVNPIHQEAGSFATPTQVWGWDTSLTAWANLTDPDAVGSSTIDSTIFAEVDDYLYVGNTVTFNEIDFVFNTFAGGPGISPTFEFSIAGPGWTAFTPIDNTDGCRQDGGIEWEVSDLTSWASVTVNSIASYYIRILRNQAGAATAPIEDRIRTSTTTEYQWDSSGVLTVKYVIADTVGVGGDVISEFARYGLVVTANGLEIDTADAVADAETKVVTGNAVYDWVTAQSYLTSETDPVWVSDSGDYSMKTWVQAEIEDSLDEYLLLGGGALTGAVTTNSTFDTVDVATLAAKVHKEDLRHFIFAFSNPNAVYDTDSLLCIKPVTEKAITITRIDVTCDADPATEPAMKLNHTDNFISRTSPTDIDVITTTNGVTTITSGFDDATIPATRCIYFAFTADPISAIKSITVDITYTID